MAQREGEPEENGLIYFDLVNEKVNGPRKRRVGIHRVVHKFARNNGGHDAEETFFNYGP